MKITSTKSEVSKVGKVSCLSELQRALVDLLIMLGVEEDARVGTMLMLKDSIPDQEEMLLYLWDNKPTPEQVHKKLVEIVLRRPKEQRSGKR